MLTCGLCGVNTWRLGLYTKKFPTYRNLDSRCLGLRSKAPFHAQLEPTRHRMALLVLDEPGLFLGAENHCEQPCTI